jgi:hypothetical protein
MQDTAPKSFVKNRITSPINKKTSIAKKSQSTPLHLGPFDQPKPHLKKHRQSLPFQACIYKPVQRHFHHGFPLLSFTYPTI